MATRQDRNQQLDSSEDNEKVSSDRQQDEQDVAPAQQPDIDGDPVYVAGFRLAITMFTICLSTMLAALDLGIVATAIPAITDDFHKLDDVGWYGNACFLLVGASSPMWGKLYKYLLGRYVYITSIILYLIGSILAAAAPNSASLIAGRAIQGYGCSGTLGGSVLMISYIAEPKRRPMLIGLWMGIFMISTILGPLIGGAFTSGVSWRWCFWVNLPVGGLILVLLLLFFHVPKHIKPAQATWLETLRQLDIPGFGLLLASLICLTLALEWGGLSRSWDDGVVIAMLVVWAVLTTGFVIVEWLQHSYAMVPLALIKPRLTWSNALYSWISNLPNFVFLFYLPIYFQSIHDQSAIESGVNTLPFLAFFSVGALLSGHLVGSSHYLQPYQLLSGLITTAGAGLLYTLNADSSKARYLGPQVLLGLGIGLGNQIPMTALQSFSKPEHVATTTGIMMMCTSISGAYFVTVAQSIFSNRLVQVLSVTAPNIDVTIIIGTGASEIRDVWSGAELAAVLNAYMVGIKDVFALALAGAACSTLVSLVIPFKKLPHHQDEKSEGKPATA
ncbi:MFS gliotoxin efflux transporter glia [Xylariales sp. PMI_506]|nr:MFS gliotoxin efflux transporter glia [Xylariales sp. PMI_506]